MQHPILLIVGTRPEAIKMAPVYFALQQAGIPVLLVSSGQHSTLLDDVFSSFALQPDIDLALGKPHQDLSYLTQTVLTACASLYEENQPSLVVVQGDTTTVMAAGLAAFYRRIPLVHVEAGLRTNDIYQPYPEEMNRRVIGLIAHYHCAPTAQAAAHLLAEGIDRTRVICTGNTVVDALRIMQEKIAKKSVTITPTIQEHVQHARAQGKKIVLLTAHRRESFDGGIARIYKAVQQISEHHEDVVVIYPKHPNPHITHLFEQSGLHNHKNVITIPPLAYHDLVYLLTNADIVMTDSGGIQEEAVSLGKPTIVLREKTERTEGVWEGVAHMVGTNEHKIIEIVEYILSCGIHHHAASIYGDGYAAQRIVRIIQQARDMQYMHGRPVTSENMRKEL